MLCQIPERRTAPKNDPLHELSGLEHLHKPLGIIVNPFSGRDVRRVAARASTSDHHEKSQQVTRLVLGALTQGVDEVFLAREPFRINERAIENLAERDQVTILKFTLTHSAADTETMAELMWQAGCRVFIVLGGDGTSRIVARKLPDAVILPLSTDTNNVFPYRLEASVAGMAAGLLTAGQLDPEEVCQRCKRIHIETSKDKDIALIDVVLLKNDFLGSLLPFAADDLDTILLARAEPAAIGTSPIGGYLLPTGHRDDHGVLARCSQSASQVVNVPISPGLHANVGIEEIRKIDFGDEAEFTGPGILAFDGDRSIKLAAGESATATIFRDGPWIIDAEHVMKVASERHLLSGKL